MAKVSIKSSFILTLSMAKQNTNHVGFSDTTTNTICIIFIFLFQLLNFLISFTLSLAFLSFFSRAVFFLLLDVCLQNTFLRIEVGFFGHFLNINQAILALIGPQAVDRTNSSKCLVSCLYEENDEVLNLHSYLPQCNEILQILFAKSSE